MLIPDFTALDENTKESINMNDIAALEVARKNPTTSKYFLKRVLVLI